MKRNGGGRQNHSWVAVQLKEKFSTLAFLQVFFLFMLLAQGAFCDAEDVPSVQVPASLLHLGDQIPSYAFLVDKSEQRLYLYQQETEGPKRIKTFTCATGENTGGKKSRGDKRTPEGVYFFTRAIESKKLSSIYGIRAFPMDYPNFLDRMDYLRGDGIWLHGTDKPLAPNSTNGCIVLDNRDVAELSQYIRLRQTPVIIEEKILSVPLQELKEEREQFYEILSEWKRSWETKQLDRYMSFYSPSFRSKGMDWHGWRAYKDHLNREYSTIQITIDPPILLKHSRNVIAVFFQWYRSDRFFNEGTKSLYFALEGGEWKIIGEEWNVHRGGEVPPPISEKILAAYPSSKANPPEPAIASPSPPEEKLDRDLAPNFQEVQDFLTTWKQSWETKNLDQFMDCYSKAFQTQGKGWDQWREHKNHLNEVYRDIQVSLEEVKMQEKDGQILVSFRQSYRSDGFKSTGQKSLILRQEENSWKIIRESFRRFN